MSRRILQHGVRDMLSHCQKPASPRIHSRRGVALPSVLFGLVVMGGLGAMLYVMTDLHAMSISNRESSVRAMHLAESGLNHALALVRDSTLRDTTLSRLLRGSNTSSANDDGVLDGYNLPITITIPKSGRSTTGGKYYVQLVDDPAEVDNDPFTDRNARVRAICRGVATDGSTATINAIVGNQSLPALAVNGNFAIGGQTTIKGRCGGLHTNGNLTVGPPITIHGGTSSTGTGSGNTVRDAYGATLPKISGADSIPMPEITAAQYCGQADYHISGTIVTNLLTGAILPLAAIGWSGGPSIYQTEPTLVQGSYCVNGNVKVAQAFGSLGTPFRLSLVVKGSLEVSGNSVLVPDIPNLMWIADGDLKLNGNATTLSPTLNGFMFAGAQCEMSGTLRIAGQVVCANRANPLGSENWVVENKSSGDTQITYGCGGFLGEFWRVIAWYPTIG